MLKVPNGCQESSMAHIISGIEYVVHMVYGIAEKNDMV